MSTTPEAPVSPPSGDGGEGPRVTREEVRDLAQLRRSVGSERKIAGVAGGLARHLDIDPVILRVALVILVFFGGAGLLLYGAGWLLVPEEGRDRGVIGLDDRSRSVALVVVGAVAALILLGDAVGQWDFPWPLVIIALVAMVVFAIVDRRRERPRVTAPPVPHRYDPATGLTAPTWTPPATAAPPAPPQPRRKPGPILFWFTLALAVVAVGGLAVADLAGANVLPSAYPAVVVGCCGLMLLVGSFYGRAGGLVFVGLVAALAMLVAAVFGPWHGAGHLDPTPTQAAGVQSQYRLSAGEIVLDLSEVRDPQGLDGKTVDLRTRTGRIEVVVPRGVSVAVQGKVSGAGQITIFGRDWDGTHVSGSLHRDAGAGTPTITLDANVLFGEIDVRSEAVK